jgi:hypothetical protein
MSENTPPPRKTLDFFSGVTQRLLAWEEAFKKGLVPKDLTPLFRRISDGAKRTFGYDKDALGVSYINALKESLPPSTAAKLSGRSLRALYGAALEEMQLYYCNGAGKGRRSVFDEQCPETRKPKEIFKDLWGDGRSSFQKTLNGLKDSESAPLFNETAVRTAVSKLCEYCQEQFLRGYSQGRDGATLSSKNLRQAVASLIPDRTQG